MTLKLKKALSKFDLAEYIHMDCGSFDICLRQAALHNEEWRAKIAQKALDAQKKSLVPQRGTLTGSFDADVELFIECIILGWGDRPMEDDDGEEIEASPENLREIFHSGREGKILFSKIQMAAVDDQLFVLTEAERKNL